MGSVRGNCCGSWPVSGQCSPGQAVRGASWDLLNGDSIQADDLLGFGDWPCGVPLPTLTHRVVAPCIYFIVCIGIKHNTIETDMSYLKLEVTYYPKLTRSADLLLHQAACNSPQQTQKCSVSAKKLTDRDSLSILTLIPDSKRTKREKQYHVTGPGSGCPLWRCPLLWW